MTGSHPSEQVIVTTLPGHGSSRISDLLQNVLAAALLARPEHVYLVSAWVSDVTVLDNTAGRFSSLVPDLPETEIRLSEVLGELAKSGTEVHVLCWDSDHNYTFRDRLATRYSDLPLQMRMRKHQHNKMLVLEGLAAVTGSMNFTWYGLNLNGEDVVLDLRPDVVAQRLASARQAWEESH